MEQFGAIGLGEDDELYKQLETANGRRHYSFLNSMIEAANRTGRRQLSHSLIKAINFHAIVGLHDEAGVYRTREVTVGNLSLPHHADVELLMEDFITQVNTSWDELPLMNLAAYVLWTLTRIHPFINGNGRTARAMCYYIICTSAGSLLPGSPILPELFRRNRDEYINALKSADDGDFVPLIELTTNLLNQQLASAEASGSP